jgi:hypothetical protein
MTLSANARFDHMGREWPEQQRGGKVREDLMHGANRVGGKGRGTFNYRRLNYLYKSRYQSASNGQRDDKFANNNGE